MPVFTGVVAAVRSFRSTGQTPRCREPNDAEGRKSTRHLEPRETRVNPGSLTARDGPPCIVVLGSMVTTCVPNLNDSTPSGVYGYASRCSRRYEVSYLRRVLAKPRCR